MRLIGLSVLALAGGVVAAQTSQFIDFESDPTGLFPVGSTSADSSLVSFGGTAGNNLQVTNFASGKTEGNSLFLPFDSTEGIRLNFGRVATSITLEMGNDDGSFIGGTVYTTVRAFLNGSLVGTTTFQNNSNNTLDDGPTFVGAFDRIDVAYTNAAGTPIALAEFIDNISFCVAQEFIDFENDPLGNTPTVFQSADSSLVRFRATDGTPLTIVEAFTGKSDGRSLVNRLDDASGVRMDFARPISAISVQMGNDDGAFIGGTVYTTLRGFYQGQPAGTITYQNNSDDDLNDGPGLSGIFDRVDVAYTNAAGDPIGLTEYIDNISVAMLSQVVDFESDPAGFVPNGFESDDSPIVRFSDTLGADLQIADFGTGKSDGQAIFVFTDDDGALRMNFDVPVTCLALEFGNDDPSRAPSYANLVGYLNGSVTREVRIPTNNNDVMDQVIAIAGEFDRIDFRYSAVDGSPIPNGLIEAVDNIRFAAKKQVIDFEDDTTGPKPNGFVSNDSPLVAFSDSMFADLFVSATSEVDGRGLFTFSDDASRTRMQFVTPVNTLSLEFGNDDGDFVGGPIWATLRGFRNNVPAGSVTIQANANDALDQTIELTGFFNRAEFYYSDAAGNPINLIEAIDNICFDVATGALPCNPADLALPYGLLDLADVVAFVSAFNAGDPLADLDNSGLLDLSDVVAFVTAFTAGCP